MRQIVLLRGINLGPNRRVPMADLRAVLGQAGYGAVRTYVQSGNVVLDADAEPFELESECARLISDRFGFDVPVIVRSADELAEVVANDPLGALVTEPKRYQVSFLSGELAPDKVAELHQLVAEPEALAIRGRELYAWHPEGVARSKLWNALAGKGLGVTATARNWTTVCTLLEMGGH
ncbi:MAG: DUF1697 domain-containing protein [Actinomycetota bacterium]|nr:DUF1697 domain-containing protein [Actinomycetota bacterium]